MTYVRTSLDAFQALFAAFPAITADQYDYRAALAERVVDDRFGEDRQHCTMLLTAHELVKAGLGSDAEAVMQSRGLGGFAMIRSGALSLEREGDADIARMGDFAASRYGRAFWPYLRACTGGPLATGAAPVAGRC